MPSTASTALVLVAGPLILGSLIGYAVRRLAGHRLAGFVLAISLACGPPLLTTLLVARFPIIGIWDGLLEGLLLGAAVVAGAHRVFAEGAKLVLAATTLLVCLFLLEWVCRFYLPPPPAFPNEDTPNLLLADALRVGIMNQSWETRSKELVCSVVYGDQYPRIISASVLEKGVALPQEITPRADSVRHILHVGDSMTFGMGVAPDEKFTEELERLEPGTQHINLGIPGTAPDAYLLVLQKWLAEHATDQRRPVDLVVMHVFEGNDLSSLDDAYPCSGWRSLLIYEGDKAAIRYPKAIPVDLGQAGFTWLRYNSPPPYLIRVLMPHSYAAAHLGAAIVISGRAQPLWVKQSEDTALQHLERILATAQDDLQKRGIAFVLVVIPDRRWVENPTTFGHVTPRILRVAERLQMPALDAWDAIADAVARGDRIFMDAAWDPHFNAAGHALIAQWLYDNLPRGGAPSQPGSISR